MKLAVGVKRLGIVVAALLAVALAALVVISVLIPAESVRKAVKAEITALTGQEPTFRGEAKVSLFPWGAVSIADVALGGDEAGTAITAERLTARLRLFPLLFGRITASDLSLRRPHIAIRFRAGQGSNWSGILDALARTLKPVRTDAPAPLSVSEIRIVDGSIDLYDEGRKSSQVLSDVEMSLAWPSIARSFVATGHFTWRGEVVTASFNLGNLAAALGGEQVGLKIRASGDPFRLAFDGHLNRRPTFRVEGTLAVDTPSLRNALQWMGAQPFPGGGFGPFALKAHTTVVGGTFALSGADVELDGNAADGVLAFATDGRPTIQGTLAADELDLSPYVSTLHLSHASSRDWNATPIVLDALNDLDVDLRLSAARINVAGAQFGRTAIGANLREGRLTVAIGEAQAYGGMLKGSVTLARAAGGAELKSQLQFVDVELENCLRDVLGIRRIEGKGTLLLAIEATGGSVLALTRTMGGTVALSAENGAISGIDVEQVLRRLERRPLSGGLGFRTGRTPFEKLSVNLRLAEGTVRTDEVMLEGTAVRLMLAGSASLPSRELDLKGTASLLSDGAGEAPPPFELPFVVQGPWDSPLVLPDADILIRRSGAAAPLLDALRDPKTRDVVRSVIDRLSRSHPATPAAQPANVQTPSVPEPAAAGGGTVSR